MEGTEAVEQSSTESSAGLNQEEWETWLNTHNKLSEEMNDTKHTLLALQELVSVCRIYIIKGRLKLKE